MRIHSPQITSQEICGQLYPRMYVHYDMTLCDHVKNQQHEELRGHFQSNKSNMNAKVGKPCDRPYLNIEAIICLTSVICITI
jgi:hypothetical protein